MTEQIQYALGRPLYWDTRECNVEVRGFSTKVKESEMGNRTPMEAPEQIFKCTTDWMLIYYAYVFIFTHTHGKS